MRQWKRLAAVILAGALLLGSVGGHAQGGVPSPETIIIGVTDLPSSLDPADAFDFNAWEVLSHLYVGLTRQVAGTLDYELALAQDVTVSADRLTYTFTLRDGLAFSDGTPITAQTFVNAIERVLRLGGDAAQAVAPFVADMRATDRRTLVFTLRRPVPYFLALVALPPYFPQHPDLAAEPLPRPFADGLVGNGPYLLERFDVGEQIVLRANPDYALGDPPLSEQIVLRRYARSQDLRDALLAHEVDLAWRALLIEHVLQVQSVDGLRVYDVPSTRVFYLYLGQNHEPTDDPLVREALSVLISRQEAAETDFAGYLSPLTSLLPPQFPEAYAPLWPDAPNVERAELTLRAGGYRERVTSRLRIQISMSRYLYGVPYSAALSRMARASFNGTDYVSYDLLTDIETRAFLETLRSGTGSLAVFAWTPLVPHPDAYLRPLLHSDYEMPRNSGYADTAIDALLDRAATLDDVAAQGALYRQVAERVYADFALVPLWQDHVQAVAWEDVVGVQVEPNFFLHYERLGRR